MTTNGGKPDICLSSSSGKQGGGGINSLTGQPHLTSAQIISPLNTNQSFLNYANPPPQQQQQQLTSTSSKQQQYLQNGIMNSQNIPQQQNSTSSIWTHPGLQTDKVLAAAAAAACQFYPQGPNFTPDAMIAALSSSTTATPSNRLNTSNSSSTSPSQTPPPSNCSQQSHLQSQWHQQQQQQQILPKTIGTHRLHLVEFSGYLTQQREPDIVRNSLNFHHHHHHPLFLFLIKSIKSIYSFY